MGWNFKFTRREISPIANNHNKIILLLLYIEPDGVEQLHKSKIQEDKDIHLEECLTIANAEKDNH